MDSVRIRSSFGDIVFEYSTLPELEKKLGDIDKVAELVEAKASRVAPATAGRQAKPGYEDVYRFLPDGSVELLRQPTASVQRVALVLFAYDRATSVQTIEKCTNVSDVVRNVLHSGNNKKYFNRLAEGMYALSPTGLAWVTSTVVPKLRKGK
jgi:hypothetical protein